ncbi:MAG: hypothetical protein O2U62_02590 [Candidatus Bathyarchaeota archaeon]|jgi:hypothetical protein|nr:hypothetical protein [Candidatus Bathyarchaeota archaeon]
MEKNKRKKDSPSLLSSQRGMSLPVTFLMLFVSLIVLISATYYFSIIRINMKTQAFKVSGAEQEMLSFEKIVSFVAWSPGSSQFYEFGNFGGEFQVVSTARRLVLNLTDGSSFQVVFFNSSIGKIAYQLPASETQDSFFLVGDNRAIINQSWSTTTQLSVSQNTENHYEIALSYRPSVGSAVTGSSDGKPVNNLRVYIVNFNSSQSVTRLGSFRLKASCLSAASNWQSYNFSNAITSLLLKASLDGHADEVSLPISSSSQGAIVNLETIVCHVKMETVGW